MYFIVSSREKAIIQKCTQTIGKKIIINMLALNSKVNAHMEIKKVYILQHLQGLACDILKEFANVRK